jgi:hypothetical protein
LTSQAKRRGAEAEIWPVNHARRRHGLLAEPIRKAGQNDQGDFYIQFDAHDLGVFEAKARRNLDIGKALKEAHTEARNFQVARDLDVTPRAFVIARPVGLGEKQVGAWWVIQRFDQLLAHG